MGFWLILIPLGLLLFSLLATQFFTQLRKPLLGFALGALPIFLLWVVISLSTVRTLSECRREITLYCDFVDFGIISNLLAVALLAISAVITIALDLARHLLTQNSVLGAPHRGEQVRPLWTSLLIILAGGGMGLAVGFMLINVLPTLTPFWLAPMLGFASAIILMVYQERKNVEK